MWIISSHWQVDFWCICRLRCTSTNFQEFVSQQFMNTNLIFSVSSVTTTYSLKCLAEILQRGSLFEILFFTLVPTEVYPCSRNSYALANCFAPGLTLDALALVNMRQWYVFSVTGRLWLPLKICSIWLVSPDEKTCVLTWRRLLSLCQIWLIDLLCYGLNWYVVMAGITWHRSWCRSYSSLGTMKTQP